MVIMDPSPEFGPSDYLQRSPEDAAPFKLEESENPSEGSESGGQDIAETDDIHRVNSIIDQATWWAEQMSAWLVWLGGLIRGVGGF
ncbi:hypothetical protein H0H92_012394 [Tricholoma furcatifolium]|nr:hypothetical protein H0H92_012394 [Tricholoma furcatifolium]